MCRGLFFAIFRTTNQLMRIFNLGLLALSLCGITPAMTYAQQRVYTDDIDRFWIAYDSARTTTDTALQQQYFQHLYIDRSTPGLKAFMKLRHYDASGYTRLINKYPKFWTSIRPNTLTVKTRTPAIEKAIGHFKELYPELRPSTMYFTIGGLRSGGTTLNDMVLVGAEIATADSNTDASEMTDWYKHVFKHQNPENIVALDLHEYVHTQQHDTDGNTLLSQVIKEGGADFVAELASGMPNLSAYMVYGREHADSIQKAFIKEMYGPNMMGWLYNSNVPIADLGYYTGYTICKAYYAKAKDKKQAIKDIILVDYANDSAVDAFLFQSGYFPQKPDKKALLAAYEASQPVVAGLSADINHHADVDTGLKTLTIYFSQTMGNGISINYGSGGKEQWPITDGGGFSADHRSFTVNLSLKPAHHYAFVCTSLGFSSASGYPLKEYAVDFTTK